MFDATRRGQTSGRGVARLVFQAEAHGRPAEGRRKQTEAHAQAKKSARERLESARVWCASRHRLVPLAGRGSRCDVAEGESTAAPEEHGSTAHKQETQARRKTKARQPRKKKNRQQTQAKANRRANPAHIVRCGQKQAGKPEGNELHATVRHRVCESSKIFDV